MFPVLRTEQTLQEEEEIQGKKFSLSKHTKQTLVELSVCGLYNEQNNGDEHLSLVGTQVFQSIIVLFIKTVHSSYKYEVL